jgi:tRNA threonylcarbamoyladenosine modification (KEOPS) complex  Pcc1 subunit
MKLRTEITVEGDPDELEKIILVEKSVRGRSRVKYEKKEKFKIVIESDDVNAMRAAVNSHLLLIKTMEKADAQWKSLNK